MKHAPRTLIFLNFGFISLQQLIHWCRQVGQSACLPDTNVHEGLLIISIQTSSYTIKSCFICCNCALTLFTFTIIVNLKISNVKILGDLQGNSV